MFSNDLEMSKAVMEEREEKIKSEQEWHKTLTDPQAKDQFFSELTKEDSSDHAHIKFIKKKITKLV